MLRSLLSSALLIGALCLPGCTMAHTQVVPLPTGRLDEATPSDIEPIAQIYANVYGYDLFGLPLTSGAARHANTWAIAWFQEHANVETVTEMILEEARQQEATHVIDLQTAFLSEWIQWTFVLWLPEAQGSATAIRVHRGSPPPGAIPVPPTDVDA